MLIRKLNLENYRAFEKASINLAPLTILVGPNNAGKSSIVSSIRLLSQTLISADPEATLLLEELGSFPDVVYGNEAKRTLGFGVEFERPEGRLGFRLKYGYRSQRRQIILREFSALEGRTSESMKTFIQTAYSASNEKQILQEIAGFSEDAIHGEPVPFFHFFPRVSFVLLEKLARRSGSNKEEGVTGARIASSSSLRRSSDMNQKFAAMQQFLRSLQYLGPFRQSPFRLYQFSGERPSKLGPTGSEAPDMLSADYFQRGRGKKKLTQDVTEWLAKADIGTKLQVKAVSSRNYDIKLQHPTTRELSNLADVGYGVSQILPVLVGGYALPKDSLLMVEQPELHIHPRAQAELAEFFYALVKRGVQSIVETHSEHLILRIQQKVALGQLDPTDVAVSYINPTPQGKEIVDLPIGEDGLFVRDWPGGFFPERLVESMNLARAPILRKKGK